MAAEIRAFVAVELSRATRDAAAGLVRILRGRPGGDGVRWVRAEGLHVTLRFLGDIDPERVAMLAWHVGRETAGLEPFALSLGELRAFPSARRPRVVALTLEPAEALAELAAAVERGVVAAGFPAEARPFRGHITLGRLREARFPDAHDLPRPPPAPTPVREVVLFQSRLGPGGSSYTPLERLALGGEQSPRTHT